MPSKHSHEEERLAALYEYSILDTPIEADYDDIVRLAASICQTPISVINLIDRDRQWFKSEIGLGVRETPLDISICAHAILQSDLFVVPDTLEDPRFACNPLVTGDPRLRFYAGALLESSDGYPLGTLCVLDYEPRELSDEQLQSLAALSRQVMKLMDLQRSAREVRQLNERLHRTVHRGASPHQEQPAGHCGPDRTANRRRGRADPQLGDEGLGSPGALDQRDPRSADGAIQVAGFSIHHLRVGGAEQAHSCSAEHGGRTEDSHVDRGYSADDQAGEFADASGQRTDEQRDQARGQGTISKSFCPRSTAWRSWRCWTTAKASPTGSIRARPPTRVWNSSKS